MATTTELVHAGRAARDDGMETAQNAADPRVAATIDAAIAEANATGQPWSANDIRARFPACSSGLVGARISAARCRKPPAMVRVGETPSTLKNTHAKPISVWVGVDEHGVPRSAAHAVLTRPGITVTQVVPAPPAAARPRPARVDPDDVPLFGGYEPPVVNDTPADELSADRRRTARQAADIAAGRHPLTGGPLHPEASTERTRTSGRTDPFTCGTCVHRYGLGHHPDAVGGYPKCHGLGAAALTHSAATDVRAWWPACPTYSERSPA